MRNNIIFLTGTTHLMENIYGLR